MGGGVLEVSLEYAEGIEERSFLCCLDCFNVLDGRRPYISIKYGNQRLISNVAKGVRRKFVWNEIFRFYVQYEDEDEDEENIADKLILEVMDKHNLSDNDIVGVAKMHVKDIVILGLKTGCSQLGSQKYRVVRPDMSYSGDLSFSVTFKRKDGEEEELGGWKESQIDAYS